MESWNYPPPSRSSRPLRNRGEVDQFFVALGRIDATALTQSIFPSLIALAGTALGFYFGTQPGGGASSTKTGGQ